MSEKFEPQEYRDNLAEKLHEIRNSDKEKPELAHAKAQGFLDAKKETEKYQKAKESHTKDIEENERMKNLLKLNESGGWKIDNQSYIYKDSSKQLGEFRELLKKFKEQGWIPPTEQEIEDAFKLQFEQNQNMGLSEIQCYLCRFNDDEKFEDVTQISFCPYDSKPINYNWLNNGAKISFILTKRA